MDMDIKERSIYVEGALRYITPQLEKPYNYMYEPAEGAVSSNCEYEIKQCVIHNARLSVPRPSLAVNGFELLEAPSKVNDFYDEENLTKLYYREIQDLALQITGGTQAVIFDHLLRHREVGRPALTFGRHGDGKNPGAVGRVHNDYSETSGKLRLSKEIPNAKANAEFLILNFWRPIVYPAMDAPLAVCDGRTVRKKDWVEADIIYPNRTGEIYLVKFSPEHRWYYYPEMHTEEVLVFKTFDSRRTNSCRMIPHCAFEDPDAPEDAPLRRSIEIRCLVTLD